MRPTAQHLVRLLKFEYHVKYRRQFILKMIKCHASLFLSCCSKNRSMFGRDLWKSSCPKPLLRQDHQEPVSQGHVQVTFKFLQGELRNFPGQPVPVLSFLWL